MCFICCIPIPICWRISLFGMRKKAGGLDADL